jgi:hypothetical protein
VSRKSIQAPFYSRFRSQSSGREFPDRLITSVAVQPLLPVAPRRAATWVPVNSRCATEQPGASMQCANPHCSKELLYLREGRAELIELELGSRDRGWKDEGGFPVNSTPSKFFWLCGDCAKELVIKRWAPSGLVLALRKHRVVSRRPAQASSTVVLRGVHDCADLVTAV